jgi:hypothetical protein
MGERNQTRTNDNDSSEDFFDGMAGDFADDDFEELDAAEVVSEKAALANKRRRAEQRLEALRLRDELGDYDFDFDDY